MALHGLYKSLLHLFFIGFEIVFYGFRASPRANCRGTGPISFAFKVEDRT
jgi:hypothetical protein